MLELYQSEDCGECAAVRRKLAALRLPFVVRTAPMDRARRERVVEAGGRPDLPLLLDPERGRTTYDVDEILNQLGSEDFGPVDDTPEAGLAVLVQREGEAESDRARRALGKASLDYVCRAAGAADREVPRLIERPEGATRVGVEAIEDWALGFRPR